MSSEIALNCMLNAGSVTANGEPRLVYLLVDIGLGEKLSPAPPSTWKRTIRWLSWPSLKARRLS
jgi:hypothetical protein